MTTFIYKNHSIAKKPYLNNRDEKNYNLITIASLLKTPHILVNEISTNNNYGYVVVHDYENFRRNAGITSLSKYFVKYQVIPDSVILLIREGRCKLYYDAMFEGYVEQTDFDNLYNLALVLNISPNQIVYVTASMNADQIHSAYCDQRNISNRMQIGMIPLFLLNLSNCMHSTRYKRPVTELTKKFICLNRIIRPHRMFLTAYVLSKPELLDQFYYSFKDASYDTDQRTAVEFRETYTQQTSYFLQPHQNLPITEHDIQIAAAQLPRIIDACPHYNMDEPQSEITKYYETSLFNVTTETQFFDSVEYNISTLFFTEKIMKPFFYGQVPIMFGPPGVIAEMRKYGFDMFDDIVDHSYDSIIDNDLRFCKLLAEIHRIDDTYSLRECNQLNVDLSDRFAANQTVLATISQHNSEVPFRVA